MSRLKILICVVVVFLGSVSPLCARIGETLEQCTARYGEGIKLLSGGMKFIKNDVDIEVRFTNGVADWISYGRVKPFSEAQILDLLALYVPAEQWRTVSSQDAHVSAKATFAPQSGIAVSKDLESADGKILAYVWGPSKRGDPVVLTIRTKERAEADKREREAAAKRAEEDTHAAELKELQGL